MTDLADALAQSGECELVRFRTRIVARVVERESRGLSNAVGSAVASQSRTFAG
jgi:hypothetical protein